MLFTEAVWLLPGFGLEKAIGHADFYPNGGEKQPGCDRDVGTHLFNLITGKIESKFILASVIMTLNKILVIALYLVYITISFITYFLQNLLQQ